MDIIYKNARFITEVLKNKEYDFMRYYPVIIDIGANIGTFSLSMLNFAETIYALEPVEENINALRKTIEKNKIEKIKPFQMAISNASYVQNMIRRGDPAEGGWLLGESGDYPVDARTLKDFMDSQDIKYADLVKIDVEGHEGKIFNTQFFPKDRIGTIIGEIHAGVMEDVPALLEYMGFKYISVPNGHFIARKR